MTKECSQFIRGQLFNAFNMTFCNEEDVVFGSFVWPLIRSDHPEITFVQNRLLMFFSKILGTKWTEACRRYIPQDLRIIAALENCGILFVNLSHARILSGEDSNTYADKNKRLLPQEQPFLNVRV